MKSFITKTSMVLVWMAMLLNVMQLRAEGESKPLFLYGQEYWNNELVTTKAQVGTVSLMYVDKDEQGTTLEDPYYVASVKTDLDFLKIALIQLGIGDGSFFLLEKGIISKKTYDEYMAKNSFFSAQTSTATISSNQELADLLNLLKQGAGTISGDEVVLSKPIFARGLEINFAENSSPIRLKQQAEFSAVINMGKANLTLVNASDKSFSRLNIPTIQPEAKLRVEGGYFLGDSKVTGGEVEVVDGVSNMFDALTIEGDLTLTASTTPDNPNKICTLADESVTINSGNVYIKGIRLNTDVPITMNGGTLTLEEVTHYIPWDDILPINESVITVNTGELILKQCRFTIAPEHPVYFAEVKDNGRLIVDGGSYGVAGGQGEKLGKAFFHLSGEQAEITIEDGTFGGSASLPYSAIIHQEKGTLTVKKGTFDSTICIEGGTANISNVKLGNMPCWNDIEGNLHIIGNADVKLANVILGKGYKIYIDPSLTNISPESLLAEGQGYYTHRESIQPDLADKSVTKQGNYLTFEKIKSTSDNGPVNNTREIAMSADVGSEGKDVKIIDNASGKGKVYEVNTPEGMTWIAVAINGNHEGKLAASKPNNSATIRLTADLDMKGIDWLPFDLYAAKFDGQGYKIYNLHVKQNNASFINDIGDETILTNLLVSGSFEATQTIYGNGSAAAGLAITNRGTIVNCGVQQSIVKGEGQNQTCKAAGLVANNEGGRIFNSYMTGEVTCSVTLTETKKVDSYAGGLVAYNNQGTLSNVYHAGGKVDATVASNGEGVSLEKTTEYENNIVANSKNDVNVDNCYDDNVDLAILNENVEAYNLSENEITWTEWVAGGDANRNFPIHKTSSDPTVVEMPFQLKVEGHGVWNLFIGEGDDAETIATKDMTLKFTPPYTYKVEPTPAAEGVELERVTMQENEGEPEELDLSKLEQWEITVTQSTILTAYFRTKSLVIENDTTVIGGTADEQLEVEEVVISAGTDGSPAEVTLENIVVSGVGEGAKEATTTIEADANVILNLSGTNDIGKLINKGTIMLKVKADAPVELNVEGVVNEGKLTDETGLITEVIGDAALAIEPLGDAVVKDNESITLMAKAIATANANVTFSWQHLTGGTWVKKERETPKVRTKVAATLSAEGEDEPTKKNFEDALVVSDDGTYRCMITCTAGNVVTTLSVRSTVKEEQKSEPEPAPVYYTISIPEQVMGAIIHGGGTYTVRENDYIDFSIEIDPNGIGEYPVVTVNNNRWNTLTPDARGNYRVYASGDSEINIGEVNGYGTYTLTLPADSLFENDSLYCSGVGISVTPVSTTTTGYFYPFGSEVTLAVTPDKHRTFIKWMDGSRHNKLTLYMREDAEAYAWFHKVIPVNNEKITANTIRIRTEQGGTILIETPTKQPVAIYTISGQCLHRCEVEDIMRFNGLRQGTYLVVVGSCSEIVIVR